MIQVVCAPTNEAIALLREVGDHRRNISMAGKPWLHRVLVGGHHIDQMRWHQRTHMRGHEVIEHRVGARRGQENEREGRRDGSTANATEGTCPERPRAPGRSTPPVGPRSLYRSFLIERAHDPGTQLWWSTTRCQVSTDRGARLFEILKQGAALGAVLAMPFNVGSRHRIDLAVEVSLHAQRFSAPHAAPPPPLSAIVPGGQPWRAPAETSPSQSGCSRPWQSRDNPCPRFPSTPRPRDALEATPTSAAQACAHRPGGSRRFPDRALTRSWRGHPVHRALPAAAQSRVAAAA